MSNEDFHVNDNDPQMYKGFPAYPHSDANGYDSSTSGNGNPFPPAPKKKKHLAVILVAVAGFIVLAAAAAVTLPLIVQASS